MRAASSWELRRRSAMVASFVLALLFAGLPASLLQAQTDLAKDLLRRGEVQRGVCAVVGARGDLALDLVSASELSVLVREPSRQRVRGLRSRAEARGIGIRRLVVDQGPLSRLPFADNMVDLVIAAEATEETLRSLSAAEVTRALRPEGRAIVGSSGSKDGEDGVGAAELKAWAADVAGAQVRKDSSGVWIEFRKPPLEGADDWSHWEHGPDNNPVSTDQVIKAPYMTQFLQKPFYIGMPSVTTAAGGRTFLAIGHIAHHRREWGGLLRLMARNGYNGTVLWERKLPQGYLVHRSAFIATRETFHMIDRDRCLLLDPETGREKGEIRIPGLEGDWKWMALQDGVLYVLAGKPEPGVEITKGDRSLGGWSWADLSKGYYGKRIPFGFGDTLVAYDVQAKRRLWLHKEESLIDSRGLALGGGRLHFYCPDRHLRALDAKSGDVAWTNGEAEVLGLIEMPGHKLISTPGFRTACLAVYTPKALIIQGQTRMNVVALSTENGRLLWTKKKITNNPNAIFVKGNVILGIGEGGSHVSIEPESGRVVEKLMFRKVACTRLTASTDSFFCRGEGTLRYDRYFKKVFVDGAARPACNDGALPANGMLYIGPWQCDCNLSLIGALARCSAGEFRFDHVATEAERLRRTPGNVEDVVPFETSEGDWPTYRGDNRRGSATSVAVKGSLGPGWRYSPEKPHVPTAPVAAGGLIFSSGEDGVIRAVDARNGELRWKFATSGPVKYPPSIWEGRAYVGSGDGYVYCLEAATGRHLWEFRAAPVERRITLFDHLVSTWPVNSGVLVEDGVAYFAAGIIDHDGTYVYAVDATTGKIKWQNNSSGHLSRELRKGVSVQGNLSIKGNQLLLAGGNQVSPAAFDRETGKCLAKPFDQGRPKANAGRFVGVFRDDTIIAGGRVLYSDPRNVSTKGSFVARSRKRGLPLNFGGVPPAWDDGTLALVNFKHGKITCCEAPKVAERIEKGFPEATDRRRWRANLAEVLREDGALRWQQDLGETERFEAISLVVARNAVVAVVTFQPRNRSQPQWVVAAFNKRNGRPLFRRELGSEPLPDGLLVDREGHVVVTMLDGSLVYLVPRPPRPRGDRRVRD